MFCSIIDAQNDNVYCGMYRDYNNRLNSITDLLAENIEDTILKIDDTINFNQITNVIFVGDGASKYKNILNNKLTASNCVFNFADENKNLPNSVSIAIAGYIKYKDNKLSSLSPLYLRKSQAERALEEKK